jgi:rhodanese-related sulfurtransferase
MTTKTVVSHFSLVLETPAAEPEVANTHFLSKLEVETDPADIKLDLQRGRTDFIVMDTRSQKHYTECRIPGAINLPYRQISAETTVDLPKDKVIVVYCWGLACNSSTKAAVKLSGLGFKVKEMIGGMEYWRKEGSEVEGTLGNDAPMWD